MKKEIKAISATIASLGLCVSMYAAAQEVDPKDNRNTCSVEYLGCQGMRVAYNEIDASLVQLGEASPDKTGDIEKLQTDLTKARDLIYAGLQFRNCNLPKEDNAAKNVFIDINELLDKGDLFRVCPHRAIAQTLIGNAQNALINADKIFDGLRAQALAIVSADIPVLQKDIEANPTCAAALPFTD
jgi:hypothetical protein